MGDIADFINDNSDVDYIARPPVTIRKKIVIVRVVADTDKAWLIELERGGEHWFPKSQCKIKGEYLYVPEWLLLRKGI